MKQCLSKVFLALAVCCISINCSAHVAGGNAQGGRLYSFDPLVMMLLLLTAWCYYRGQLKLCLKVQSNSTYKGRRFYCFWGGWIVLVTALATPLDTFGEELFSIHMIQHELMMLVASPLLVLSQPSSLLLAGCPNKIAGWTGGLVRILSAGGLRHAVSSPVLAWTIHLVGLWGWHIPFLFEASLRNSLVHTLQHTSFLVIGLIFWWTLLRGKVCRHHPGIAVLYLFTTTVHASLLGALLTFSPVIWYPTYQETAPEWGISAIADQQLGGLIMWMPAGIVFMAAAAILLVKVLKDTDKQNQHVRAIQ